MRLKDYFFFGKALEVLCKRSGCFFCYQAHKITYKFIMKMDFLDIRLDIILNQS
ncbi:hypothetical protein Lepto7376_1409 [[Leptolyngbya] sp. PCC 7376]|nr:hypothetical protein Lepto7376_1409 [[Leptolyngbya] sp. PCC 7376]